ncbi:MAG: holo-ACP synthase [Deltaproteobacteria bacterium]|nr:holo-ACP synthase [Deltaproteobacteria bacterium]
MRSIGTDIVRIERVAALLDRYGDRFRQRVFTPGEIAYCQGKKQPAIHFAARFGAKEAMLKALGTGLSQGITWKDVEVCRQRGAAPYLRLHGRAAEIFQSRGFRQTLVSLSHEQEFALAFVVIS